jgi:hypothetical protein
VTISDKPNKSCSWLAINEMTQQIKGLTISILFKKTKCAHLKKVNNNRNAEITDKTNKSTLAGNKHITACHHGQHRMICMTCCLCVKRPCTA